MCFFFSFHPFFYKGHYRGLCKVHFGMSYSAVLFKSNFTFETLVTFVTSKWLFSYMTQIMLDERTLGGFASFCCRKFVVLPKSCLGGISFFLNSQVQKRPKSILGGGSTHFKKVPTPLRGGGSSPIWTVFDISKNIGYSPNRWQIC